MKQVIGFFVGHCCDPTFIITLQLYEASKAYLKINLMYVRRGKSQSYQPEDATLNDRNVRFVHEV